MDRFDAEGSEGFYDCERDGRPRKLGDGAEAKIDRKPSPEAGYYCSRWTAERLAATLDDAGTGIRIDSGVAVH